MDGAYPGEGWLADWCAAYRPHLPPPTRGLELDVDVGDGAPPGGVAELLYCLATLQVRPPAAPSGAQRLKTHSGVVRWLGG